VFRADVLHITFGIVISIPEDCRKIEPAHALERFALRAATFFDAVSFAIILA
jgi:hypothetical protein